MKISLFLALITLLAVAQSCSLTRSTFLDKKCKVKAQTKILEDEEPNKCKSGENPEYPYYKWECGSNGIQMTYFSDKECTNAIPNSEPIYLIQKCNGPSPANHGFFMMFEIGDCCPRENPDGSSLPDFDGPGIDRSGKVDTQPVGPFSGFQFAGRFNGGKKKSVTNPFERALRGIGRHPRL